MPNLYDPVDYHPKIAVMGLISDREVAGYNNELYEYPVTH